MNDTPRKHNTSLRYMQVYLDLRDKITGGAYPAGAQLPVEKDLVAAYGISITTLRRAVEMLCAQGALEKKQGCGTFVTGALGPGADRPDPDGNAAARGLRVAVVLPDVSRITPEGDAWHWQLNLRRIDGVYQEAARYGAQVVVHDLSERFDLGQFDAAIVFRVFSLERPEIFSRLVRPLELRERPCVVVSEYDLRFAAKYWIVENLALEFLNAYRYLAGQGTRRLLVMGRNLTPENPRVAVLEYAFGPGACQFLENPTSDTESARRLLSDWLARHGGLNGCDTVFCTTDLQALGALDALLAHGLRVPDDVNLMGCDNISEAADARVPLTTFQFSDRRVGAAALELACRAANGGHPDGLMLTKRGRIIERASVRAKTPAPEEPLHVDSVPRPAFDVMVPGAPVLAGAGGTGR